VDKRCCRKRATALSLAGAGNLFGPTSDRRRADSAGASPSSPEAGAANTSPASRACCSARLVLAADAPAMLPTSVCPTTTPRPRSRGGVTFT
jgi:hypothetical protein